MCFIQYYSSNKSCQFFFSIKTTGLFLQCSTNNNCTAEWNKVLCSAVLRKTGQRSSEDEWFFIYWLFSAPFQYSTYVCNQMQKREWIICVTQHEHTFKHKNPMSAWYQCSDGLKTHIKDFLLYFSSVPTTHQKYIEMVLIPKFCTLFLRFTGTQPLS